MFKVFSDVEEKNVHSKFKSMFLSLINFQVRKCIAHVSIDVRRLCTSMEGQQICKFTPANRVESSINNFLMQSFFQGRIS